MVPQIETSYYRIARGTTLLSYVALLATIGFGAWFYGPAGVAAKLALWLLAIAGLLLVLPGLVRGSKRSYQWLCFILLMYFIWYVQAVFSFGSGDVMPEQVQSMADVLRVSATANELTALAFTIICFCAAMFAARGKQ
ncbi:MAG: DUF2069 domain-containing protein [Pseudomonadales bacterium]|nr:MAG: DUF2069 domain-containing protein [Pseudomonadales bacterium]